MASRIVAATLRGLSYIAANLRPEDRAEIDCQLDHWSPALLALTALHGSGTGDIGAGMPGG